ncbi:MAG: hypothetical protein ACM3VS_03130 [Candidatus Dadabacteria bacterium]
MNRRNLVPLLLILAIVSVGYAIYRSTAVRITTTVNNQQTIYGEPQNGLMLGLCLFAGFCVLAVAYIIERSHEEVVIPRKEERTDSPRRILT